MQKTQTTQADVAEMVYPIHQATYLAQNLAEELASPLASRIRTNLKEVDKILNPFLGGTLITVLGRPQNGKSFFSDYMLNTTMEQIVEKGEAHKKITILISMEVSVEVTALKWMVRHSHVPLSKVLRGECDPGDLERIDTAAYKVMGLPLIIIGHSSQRSRENKRIRPNMTPESINDALDYVFNEYKNPETGDVLDPAIIVTDYLQLMHVPNNADRRGFFTDAMRWAKDVALWGGCPHIFNIQAKREVDERDIKIPQLGDGGETAAIEQFSDVVFSVHMPKVYNIETMPEFTTWNIPEITVTDHLYYLVLLKQKDGFANKGWIFYADFDGLNLKEFKQRNHH